jgi:hypothetical protein
LQAIGLHRCIIIIRLHRLAPAPIEQSLLGPIGIARLKRGDFGSTGGTWVQHPIICDEFRHQPIALHVR